MHVTEVEWVSTSVIKSGFSVFVLLQSYQSLWVTEFYDTTMQTNDVPESTLADEIIDKLLYVFVV
jgi:hypothetical protein